MVRELRHRVYIDVTSAHILDTVTLTVNVNGFQIAQQCDRPLVLCRDFTYSPLFSGSSTTLNIVVSSSGGGTGGATIARP